MSGLKNRLRKSAAGRKEEVVLFLWLVLIERNTTKFAVGTFIRMMEGMIANLELEYVDFPLELQGRVGMYLNLLNMGVRRNLLLRISKPHDRGEELYFFTGSSLGKIDIHQTHRHLDEFETHHVCHVANCIYSDFTSDLQVVKVRGASKLVWE